jgi:hypothetical protein
MVRPAQDGRLGCRNGVTGGRRGQASKAVGFGDQCVFEYYETVLLAEIYVNEEKAEFHIADNRLFVFARTSTAGPGYHILLTGLLDSLARKYGVQWQFDDEDYADETGFFQHRDKGELDISMAQHLRSLAEFVLNEGKGRIGSFVLALDQSLGIIPNGNMAATPLGYRDERYFRDVAQSEGAELLNFSRDWYLWWGRETDASFWFKTGIALLWQRIPWRKPQTERERRAVSFARQCFALAAEMGSGARFPVSELEELRSLQDDGAPDYPIIHSERLGYLRGLVRRPLTGGWSITVPGYFYEDKEEDGTAAAYYYDRIAAWGSSIQVVPSKGDQRFEDYLNVAEAEIVDDFVDETRKGKASLQKSLGEWILHGRIASKDSLAILSVRFRDLSALDEAKGIVQSAHYAGPADGA